MTKYGCNGCLYLKCHQESHYCMATVIYEMNVGPDPFFPVNGVALVYQIIEENIMNTPEWCPLDKLCD